ncbi:aspartate/glutamate racemase family protein [Geodermatophilus sp. YIM 151500]|uniref:aspartate/glutamate racemase family protein n=1 Tax=Geodermatophilus sp. YIM 151500 TaxID=2984531 RepID=UPI0021E462E7|nr:aspartate/glutamate racemase family protein [Geodermatophilus sp. YIM 151500]MCV2487737.1 aspartate/glutamate racemase family protein [Geodermatophilus sp. YIM 151500]
MAGMDQGAPMRILVVNVNTTAAMTDTVVAAARRVAAPTTEVIGLTPRFGAASVEGHFESYLAAVAVMDAVASYDGPYDAVVQAGFGEHGREGLQELVEVPVVDITEAAALTACLLGRRFGVVTTLQRAVPLIEDRLRLAGLDDRCAGVRASGLAVLELEEDAGAAVEAMAAQAKRLVEEDGADVVCLGCAGMAGLGDAVEAATGVPVVDGVAAAVPLAEGLVRQGLRTSKAGGYAAPRPKELLGWPLPGRRGAR